MDLRRIEAVLSELAARLDGGPRWVVGGSAGLALRGARLDREPRDVDVYADRAGAAALHARLAELATDEPVYSETGLYRSTLSHYAVGGLVVELVCGFRIAGAEACYDTEVDDVLYPQGQPVAVGGKSATLVPLAHELLFNVLRDRPDRTRTIAELMRAEPALHEPALAALLERNRWPEPMRRDVWRLVRGDAGLEESDRP